MEGRVDEEDINKVGTPSGDVGGLLRRQIWQSPRAH